VNSIPEYVIKLNFKSEKIPDILTNEDIKKFLFEAKRLEHPWYPIWATTIRSFPIVGVFL